MAATCVYCHKAMAISPPKGMTTYHGQCRLDAIRKEWRDASKERRAVLETEAEAIKKHQPTEAT
jgi:hypothetical protein